MPNYRVQIGFEMDSALPRDVVTINPHYDAPDANALLVNLANNIKNNPPASATSKFTLKAYDAAKAPPSYPVATLTSGTTTMTSPYPRELALCLSYYATFNRPRFRGRVYIPGFWFAGNPGVRPTSADRTAVAKWADMLGKQLPVNAHWIVWSKVENASQGSVSNWWIDDEWDTVRSRGLRGTTRLTGTIP